MLFVNFHRHAVTQVVGLELRVADQPAVDLAEAPDVLPGHRRSRLADRAPPCPSPKPHPTRSGAPRCVNPSTGPRPRAWLEVGRAASLDRQPCTVTPSRDGGRGAGGPGG